MIFLGLPKSALSLIEQDLDLGRRSIKNKVGLAVSVEVARIDADDCFVDRDADQPHPAVVLELVGIFAERARAVVVGGFLGAQEEVDPRPAVVGDEDVVDLVAIQVLELEVADPVIKLVELERLESEVIGELLVRRLGQGRRRPENESQ